MDWCTVDSSSCFHYTAWSDSQTNRQNDATNHPATGSMGKLTINVGCIINLLIIAVMKQANHSHLVLVGKMRQHGKTASARNSKTTANVIRV